MPRVNRKTAPRVVGGRVVKKNNWVRDRGDFHAWTQGEIRIDRRDPGTGYRHLLTVTQLRRFLALLPEWDEMTRGLDAVILDAGSADTLGWHRPGVIALCAWERELWWPHSTPLFVDAHRETLDLLEVERVRRGDGFLVRWTEEQARSFQLLHVLTHELGHHHDRMTTATRRDSARGEEYAEDYADRVLAAVLPVYQRSFTV